MGLKTKAKDVKFEKIGVPEEIATEVRNAAETSMGTEITEEDLANIMRTLLKIFHILTLRRAI